MLHLLVVEPVRCVAWLVVVLPPSTRKEQIGHVVTAEDAVVAHVIDIVVRYRHERKFRNPRRRTYDVRERRVAFGTGYEQKAFQPFGSRCREPRHADFHVVTHEIENDGAMNAARVHLVFVETDTPHSVG